MNKTRLALFSIIFLIIGFAMFFIVFGNKEGKFKYYEDGLSITIQNNTDQKLKFDVSQLDGNQLLFSLEVEPNSTSSITKKDILPKSQDISLLIDYELDGKKHRLEEFPYIDSMENKYVLQLEFNKDGEIFGTGLNDGIVFPRESY